MATDEIDADPSELSPREGREELLRRIAEDDSARQEDIPEALARV